MKLLKTYKQLFENRKENKERLLNKFIELSNLYYKNNNSYFELDSLPSEIEDEFLLLQFLYRDWREYKYWGDSFEPNEKNRVKTCVKKYIEKSLIEKWENEHSIFIKMEKNEYLNTDLDKKPMDQERKLIYQVLKNMMIKNKPEKLSAIEKFNI